MARARGAKGVPSPAACWVLAAVLGAALPEMIWRSIPDDELEPEAKEAKGALS